MHARMKALRADARDERARHAAEKQFLEMLLGNGMQGVPVIMRSGSQERTFLGKWPDLVRNAAGQRRGVALHEGDRRPEGRGRRLLPLQEGA